MESFRHPSRFTKENTYDNFDKYKNDAISILQSTKDYIISDPELINYAKQSIILDEPAFHKRNKYTTTNISFVNESRYITHDNKLKFLLNSAHPKWQNLFVEIIVLLVKEIGCHVLLTTHSSNFMLAIDAYMRKYEITQLCNFYQTEYIDNGPFVSYKCVNDSLDLIYQDFVTYLSDAKLLRNKYLSNDTTE